MIRHDFPAEIGAFVLGKAREYDHQEAIDAVEQIRDFLGGDPGRMRELSDGWNAIEAVVDYKSRLNQNNAELAGSCEGPAYESFKLYLEEVAGAMDSTTTAMGDMSGT